ncbi:MAG: hypothetical protein R2789_02140 [Microthrixaceae bacterium]
MFAEESVTELYRGFPQLWHGMDSGARRGMVDADYPEVMRLTYALAGALILLAVSCGGGSDDAASGA